MTEIKNSILAGIFFGVVMGLFFSILFGSDYGLISGIFSGILFGVGIYLFVNSKTVKSQTQIENIHGLTIIHSGGANHFINVEAVGGKLYLLTDKVLFKSHNFNAQNHSQTILLEQIKEIGFYNTLGLIPNGLSITTSDDKIEKYVVNNRRLWKEKIENQKTKQISANR